MWTIAVQDDDTATRRPSRLVLERCPHCNGEYGSASLPIHALRCRVLMSTTDDASETQPVGEPTKKCKPIPPLSAMCIKFILANLNVTCVDGLFSQPATQAWLLASLPEAVTQQVLVYMVHRVQTMTTSYDKHKAQLRAAQNKCVALEAAVDQARAVRRDRDRLVQVVAVKSNGIVQLKAETESLQKQLTNVNSTVAKLVRQVEVLERAKSRDVAKARPVRARSQPHIPPASRSSICQPRIEPSSSSSSTLQAELHTSTKRLDYRPATTAVRPRPRSTGSNIPLPRSAMSQPAMAQS